MTSVKAAEKVLRAIRLAKPWADGRVFRALHVAEGLLVAALKIAEWKKKARKGKAKKKKKKEAKS